METLTYILKSSVFKLPVQTLENCDEFSANIYFPYSIQNCGGNVGLQIAWMQAHFFQLLVSKIIAGLFYTAAISGE
jgi:predicted nucleic acid binding AN1-type Zn finger protein